MSDLMAVLLNGIAQIEYDRRRPISGRQREYLDALDAKMDAGLELDGSSIARPDPAQRARFVASNLANAIKENNEVVAAAMTTYLAVRMPELRQVRIREQDGQVSIELIFDQDYIKQYPVTFTKPGALKS
jgi:hypothetical protein